MTVGELLIPPGARGLRLRSDYNLISRLEDLGIWDAEVLEGRLLVDANGETGPNEVQLLAEDNSFSIVGHDGSKLRIIVLPKGE